MQQHADAAVYGIRSLFNPLLSHHASHFKICSRGNSHSMGLMFHSLLHNCRYGIRLAQAAADEIRFTEQSRLLPGQASLQQGM